MELPFGYHSDNIGLENTTSNSFTFSVEIYNKSLFQHNLV